MSYSTVIGDKVVLYGYIDRDTESRVNVCAQLPNEDWNGQPIHILNWKLGDGGVLLTYSTSREWCAPIYDTNFPVVRDSVKLAKPTLSKAWKLDQYGDYWRNEKTGKKVYV